MHRTCQKIISYSFLFISLFLFTVKAASLSLTNIGALSTDGAKYSEWWYTIENPILQGTSAANADVKIKINTTENTVKADANGKWVYSTTMPKGDYSVVITSASETYSFTLHAGQSMPIGTTSVASTTQSTATTPVTGSNQIVGLSVSLTLIGIGAYIYFNSRRNKKAYVSTVLKSLK